MHEIKKIDVGKWLADRTQVVNQRDSFDSFIDGLLKADTWLCNELPPNNKLTFSIGAFIGSNPIFVLISNFQSLSGPDDDIAASKLSVFKAPPIKKIKIYSAGSGKKFIVKSIRKKLKIIARKNRGHQKMYSALEEVTREVAEHDKFVGKGCFTSYITSTGGGAQLHGIDNQISLSYPSQLSKETQILIEKKFGIGFSNLKMTSMTMYRGAATEEEHKARLRDDPNNPNTHNDYGNFLKKKGDIEGAKREYQEAVDLSPNHPTFLSNLAGIIEDNKQAEKLYKHGLQKNPDDENLWFEYTKYLVRTERNKLEFFDEIKLAIEAAPKSHRLYLLRAIQHLKYGNAKQAVEDCNKATKFGSKKQSMIACVYAHALHLSGAPLDDCIPAYRSAISLNSDSPDIGKLKLNLAQILFIKGYHEAHKLLGEAIKSKIDDDARLEAQFYLLSHTSNDTKTIVDEIKVLLNRGGRLNRDIQQNIEVVRQSNPDRADDLEIVKIIMRGQAPISLLDTILNTWK